MTISLGIEEEFVLLDPETLRAVPLADCAIAALGGRDTVVREYFPSQLEFASPVLHDAADALASLARFRCGLAAWAAEAGVVAAATGTPLHPEPAGGQDWAGRYAQIADDTRWLTYDHQINGLHVHVGIPDRATGIVALNRLRPWLPVLLALSANSPHWSGVDTGFASWRSLHSRRWTTYGIPPHFADVDAYEMAIARHAGIGATSDPRTINWCARLSPRYPTVEVRVCDSQLGAHSSVALALIIRALVGTADDANAAKSPDAGVWDAALWHAARHGVSATLVDPDTMTLAPARAVIAKLAAAVTTGLTVEENAAVCGFLQRVIAEGSGADRQRIALASGGRAALGQLLRDALSDSWPGVVASAVGVKSGDLVRPVTPRLDRGDPTAAQRNGSP
ncbi:carboxylate-amine ligase [Microbacterium trichothecenolyticum]|jgi:carboxylate-amine ligase|uniref:carboxylate-amine ligase n=1 Tax=Microbacterium trichothecenolyticum TaxID=69370 RepID=UPI0028567980|nr:YbdK family carboxylate-amine ligase [Microbacterium trichothecenolyticum]MDR7185476.1 carboxylate-amine ligase [Microbacterium trichothecenolyticum]